MVLSATALAIAFIENGCIGQRVEQMFEQGLEAETGKRLSEIAAES